MAEQHNSEVNKKEFVEMFDKLSPKEQEVVFRFLALKVKKSESKDEIALKTYSLTELEQIFGVTHRTLLNWVKSGYLPVTKIGGKWRIFEEDLFEFVREQKTRKRSKDQEEKA